MCGIAGVVGRKGAAAIVRTGLLALEYRGYDSCGVAWPTPAGLQVRKAVGSVDGLVVPSEDEAEALGHTRWATHGGVTEANAHPHLDCKGRVAVVHNGVINNHERLRAELQAQGHRFTSQTDSEVLAHLWETLPGDGLQRMQALVRSLQGTYSLAVLDPGQGIHVAKQRNPLWVAHRDGVAYLASDPVALRAHVPEAIPLEDGDAASLTRTGIQVRDQSGAAVQRAPYDIRSLDDRAEKAGYEHYMLKEIHESPAALNRLVARHVRQAPPYIDLGLPDAMTGPAPLLFLGAGTSYHAALLSSQYVQRLAGSDATARATPEFKDDTWVPPADALVVAMSQSGETLDTLQALHRLRSHPAPTLAFTNQAASSIARQSDHSIPLLSGTEVSVAATKTFLSQALLGHLLALGKARATGLLSDGAQAERAHRLVQLPRLVERTLLRKAALADLARGLVGINSLFVLAKGLLLPIAMETSLKLKEIAYQHAEAYPAGELKHGPFALLTPETGVLFLHGPGPHQDAVRNSIQEVQARGAQVFVLAVDGMDPAGLPKDRTVWLPDCGELLAPFVFAVAGHLLSYWVAKARALPIDRPRNLAKSVTVE